MMKSAILATLFGLSPAHAAGSCTSTVTLTPPEGKPLTLQVEIARTLEEREKGLMFRQHLDAGKGMLFTWPHADLRYMWMKNTFIPLDMIFADNGRVTGIVHDAVPHDLTPLTAGGPADAVVEVPGGYTGKMAIGAGWRLTVKDCGAGE